MRDLMLSLLQPRFDAMRDEVIAALEARIIVLSAQAANAFESALLSALSDLDAEGGHSVRIEPIAPPAKRQRAVGESSAPRAKLVQAPRKTATRHVKTVDEKPAPTAKVVHRDIKPAKLTVHGHERVRAVMRCGKCGALGFRSDGCGTSHQPANAVVAPTVAPYIAAKAKVDRTPVVITIPPPPVRAPKPTAAAIAEHRSRLTVLRERSAQYGMAPADPPVASIGEDEDDEELDVAIERAERTKKSGAMPKPRSSFRVERGEVAELDFEGGE